MADLQSLSAPSATTALIKSADGIEKIGLDQMIVGSRMTRKLYTQTDSTAQTLNAGRSNMILGPVFPNVTGFKANSIIRMRIHVPMREDLSNAWGGVYVEPQVSFDAGSSWFSLGNTGFECMYNQDTSIKTYRNVLLFDPQQTSDFSLQVRFYLGSYDNGVQINSGHSMNSISGSAALMGGDIGQQHWCGIQVEELAVMVS